MQAHIKAIRPDLIELNELRPGDNFEHSEHEGWVFKMVSGVKQFAQPESDREHYKFAVVECSGEVMRFNESDKVYPLLESTTDFSYDFERKFEEDR